MVPLYTESPNIERLRLADKVMLKSIVEEDPRMPFENLVLVPGEMVRFIKSIAMCYKKGVVPFPGILLPIDEVRMQDKTTHLLGMWFNSNSRDIFMNHSAHGNLWSWCLNDIETSSSGMINPVEVFLRKAHTFPTAFTSKGHLIDFDFLIRECGSPYLLGLSEHPEEQELWFCRLFLALLESPTIQAILSSPVRTMVRYKSEHGDFVRDLNRSCFTEAIHHPITVLIHGFLLHRRKHLVSRLSKATLESESEPGSNRDLEHNLLWKPWVRFAKFLENYSSDMLKDTVYSFNLRCGMLPHEVSGTSPHTRYQNILVHSLTQMVRACSGEHLHGDESDLRSISFEIPKDGADRVENISFALSVLECFSGLVKELFETNRYGKHSSSVHLISMRSLQSYRYDLIAKICRSQYYVITKTEEHIEKTTGDGPLRQDRKSVV